jgi:chromosomal replication initiation ATPase DnaA
MKEEIVKLVSRYFEMTPEKMFEFTRKREQAEARFYCFLMLKRFTKLSLSEIGEIPQQYGRVKSFQHDNVLYGINKIKDLCSSYMEYKKIEIDLMNNIKFNNHSVVVMYVDLVGQCLKRAS